MHACTHIFTAKIPLLIVLSSNYSHKGSATSCATTACQMCKICDGNILNSITTIKHPSCAHEKKIFKCALYFTLPTLQLIVSLKSCFVALFSFIIIIFHSLKVKPISIVTHSHFSTLQQMKKVALFFFSFFFGKKQPLFLTLPHCSFEFHCVFITKATFQGMQWGSFLF